MKIKCFVLFFFLLVLLFASGCDMIDEAPSEALMPYGSDEYESGNWTVEELVNHFKSLGFRDIKTDVSETIYPDQVGIKRVEIEIYPSDSWFTEYRRIAKGDSYETHRELIIEAKKYVSAITINNNAEFANIVKESEENAYEALKAFLREHEGEYIEFDATVIKNQPPTETSKGVYMWFAIEHGNAILYKNGVKAKEIGENLGNAFSDIGTKIRILGIIKDESIKILWRKGLMPIDEPQETIPNTTEPNSGYGETESTTPTEDNKQYFIINKSTKKFHYTYCHQGKRIKDKNKKEYYGLRDNLIKDGYLPCEVCNP